MLSRITVILGLTAILVSCVPINSRVQENPDWSGLIIDAENLEPIEDVIVRHTLFRSQIPVTENFPHNNFEYLETQTTTTNKAGDFYLNGVVTEKIVMRLPVSGIFFEDAFKSLHAQEYENTFILGSNVRLGKTLVNRVGYVALDRNRDKLAPLPFEGFAIDLQNINVIFKICSSSQLRIALEKTNTARKVLQASGWHKLSEGEFLSQYERKIIHALYMDLPNYWQWVRKSCRLEKRDEYTRIRQSIDNLNLEVDRILEVTSPLSDAS
ncbi:hypothetical protein A9Q83_04590 [Alphaproteobacteria bacterium 46_93_T64]|nr:hypothetical protein A9Q83_04590 [Alphaproteobacteria bacterium 46_93_T64]